MCNNESFERWWTETYEGKLGDIQPVMVKAFKEMCWNAYVAGSRAGYEQAARPVEEQDGQ